MKKRHEPLRTLDGRRFDDDSCSWVCNSSVTFGQDLVSGKTLRKGINFPSNLDIIICSLPVPLHVPPIWVKTEQPVWIILEVDSNQLQAWITFKYGTVYLVNPMGQPVHINSSATRPSSYCVHAQAKELIEIPKSLPSEHILYSSFPSLLLLFSFIFFIFSSSLHVLRKWLDRNMPKLEAAKADLTAKAAAAGGSSGSGSTLTAAAAAAPKWPPSASAMAAAMAASKSGTSANSYMSLLQKLGSYNSCWSCCWCKTLNFVMFSFEADLFSKGRDSSYLWGAKLWRFWRSWLGMCWLGCDVVWCSGVLGTLCNSQPPTASS